MEEKYSRKLGFRLKLHLGKRREARSQAKIQKKKGIPLRGGREKGTRDLNKSDK